MTQLSLLAVRYRAQVLSAHTGRWVDGGLYGRRRDAWDAVARLRGRHGENVCDGRVVEVTS